MTFKNAVASFALLLCIFLLSQRGLTYEVGYLRLTGKFLSMEAGENFETLDTLTATIDGALWIFEIAEAENLNGTGLSARSTLREIVPARLTINADRDILEEIQERDPGEDIAMTGFLYPASRVFFVTRLERVETRG